MLRSTQMSIKDFFNCYWDYLIIDTRSNEDYEEAHIAHAVNIPFSSDPEIIWKNIKSYFPEKRDKIILYCTGDASTKVNSQKMINFLISNEEELKKCLRCSNFPSIHILESKFSMFIAKYPFLCTPNFQGEIVYPSMITENLFLSGKHCAENEKVINDLRIQGIVNCSNNIPNYFEKTVKYHRVPIEDSLDEDLSIILPDVISFLKENEKKTILVHCQRGQSRSASVVIAFLMSINKWSFDEAFNFVKLCRPYIKLNNSFEQQLRSIEVSS